MKLVNNEKRFQAALSLPLLKQLTHNEIELLKQNHSILQSSPKQLIYQEGHLASSVYLVLQGGLKIFNKTQNSKVVFDFLFRGDLGGFLYFLDQEKKFLFSGCTLEHSTLMVIPRAIYEELQISNAHFYQQTYYLMSLLIRQLTSDHKHAHLPVPERLAKAFLQIYTKRKANQIPPYEFVLTKQDLAERIRAKPETVIRCCSNWSKRGLLKTQGKHFNLLNLEGLKKIANQA